jgi:hypothetical protein
MAGRSWAISVATAIGVAAVAGAAQLGLGYGLGVISWQVDAVNGTIWINSLTWVTFLAASSTIFGALVADRLTTPAPAPDGRGEVLVTVASRVAIGLSAAVGALITVPLVALPSRAPRPDNVAPYFTTGGYAVAGVIIGLLVAFGALYVRAVATNVIASAAWLWTLAAVAVADVVRSDGTVAGSAQLGTWQFTDATWVRGMVNLPGALLMLAIALIIGALAAWPAGRRGDNRVGVAVAGAAGPVLVAAAYFLVAPVRGDDQHLSAFVMAPYAVLAGLAGSVLVSAIGPKGARTQARARRRTETAQRTAKDAAEYTDWTQALQQAEKLSDRREAEQAERHERAGEEAPQPATPVAATSGPVTASGATNAPTDSGTPNAPRTGAATATKPGPARATAQQETTVDLEEPTYAGAPTGIDSARDLDEDAYAPTRAYGSAQPSSARAYAEDTADEPEPVPTVKPVGGPATGRAAVKEPLWPTQATEPTPAPKARGRMRRGSKNTDDKPPEA